MDAKKVALLKEKLAKESVSTAMVLDVVDFVETIANRCESRGAMLSDKEHHKLMLTASYLLAKKTEGFK